MALTADALLGMLERRAGRPRHSTWRGPAAAMAVLAVIAAAIAVRGFSTAHAVVVGSKNFTEQFVLGELVAQTLERYGGLTVDRRLNLGGTFICDRALRTGDIDVYVEYTGTALTAVFKQPVGHDRAQVLDAVRQQYATTGRTMLAPLGFNNTFAILVRGSDARALKLRTITDAVPIARTWHAGFGYEFLERQDGFPGLARTYGLQFAESPKVLDLSLTYRALAEKQVDLIAGDATAGLIEALDLAMLADDRHYFPPYDAVPVVNTPALLREPKIRAALDRLTGRVHEADMRRLNYEVEGRKRDVTAVVREFLDHLEK
jgi:glycine betaine/choline ABC-type transport system substrate-binding protein